MSQTRRLFLASGPAAGVMAALAATLGSDASSAHTGEVHQYELTPAERRILLDNYQTWLEMELRYLQDELNSAQFVAVNNAAWFFHWREYGSEPCPPPSTRAAAVLAEVGCDWRSDLEGRP